jgi:hypothetical protein
MLKIYPVVIGEGREKGKIVNSYSTPTTEENGTVPVL